MTLLKLRSRGDSVRMLQELLHKLDYALTIDGIFGMNTEKAVMKFQKENGLVCDGIVGTKTWTVLFNKTSDDHQETEKKFLSEKDLKSLAKKLDIELASVKAVYEVESSGRGFLTDGRPKILFEGHIFWKRLKKHEINPLEYVVGNEDVLYSKWTTKFYKGGAAEYERLDKAKLINENAALESASWGIFQIMGYHYELVGYNSVKSFVNAMNKSEAYHLKAFGKFIESEGLLGFLRTHDWADFARRYNGSGYKKNKYDEKIERAYSKYLNV